METETLIFYTFSKKILCQSYGHYFVGGHHKKHEFDHITFLGKSITYYCVIELALVVQFFAITSLKISLSMTNFQCWFMSSVKVRSFMFNEGGDLPQTRPHTFCSLEFLKSVYCKGKKINQNCSFILTKISLKRLSTYHIRPIGRRTGCLLTP